MPRWDFHSRTFTALRRRFRLNRGFTEINTGISPVVIADKHWHSDALNVYGMFTQNPCDGAQIPCCGLAAGANEVLVSKVEMWLSSSSAFGPPPGFATVWAGWRWHLFTPHPNYNPTDGNFWSFWYPWLQMRQSPTADQIALPGTIGFSGQAIAHQTIALGGGPPITTFGPMFQTPFLSLLAAVDLGDTKPQVIWGFQDPPLRVRPWQFLVVQGFDIPNRDVSLNVNWYFSEQEEEGAVG